jgi:hypothetical protein
MNNPTNFVSGLAPEPQCDWHGGPKPGAPELGRVADRGIMTHLFELGPLTALMLDLRKQSLGKPFNPITVERLDECSKSIQKIMQCRQKGLYK